MDGIVLSNDNVTEGARLIEDKVTIDERPKYLRMMQKRYAQADPKERGRLLDEMHSVGEPDRKALIRLMNGNLRRQPRNRQGAVPTGQRSKKVKARARRRA